MRKSGYIEIANGKVARNAFHCQGSVSSLDDWNRKAIKKLEAQTPPDGFYKATISIDGRWQSIKLGQKVKDIAKEAGLMAKGCQTKARTSSPGIAGYQQAANAASGRLYYLDMGKRRIAKWLKETMLTRGI